MIPVKKKRNTSTPSKWWEFQKANNFQDKQNTPLPVPLKEEIDNRPHLKQLIKDCRESVSSLQKYAIIKNKIVIVTSIRPADDTLLYISIKLLLPQIRRSSLVCDFYVVINCIKDNSDNIFSAGNTSKLKELGFHTVLFTGVNRNKLKPEEQNNSHIPGDIQINRDLLSHENHFNLIVIQQENGSINEGKIRAFRDVFNLLFNITTNTGYRPAYLFLMDAESRLYARNSITGKLYKNNEQTFLKLINSLKNDSRIVCAKMYPLPFKNAEPDWNSDTSFIIKHILGTQGVMVPVVERIKSFLSKTNIYCSPINGIFFSLLSGAATLGDYAVITGVMQILSKRFPGLKNEDYFLTIIIRLMGIGIFHNTNIIVTMESPYKTELDECRVFLGNIGEMSRIVNRPDPSEKEFLEYLSPSDRQFFRWAKAKYGIQNYTGEQIINTIVCMSQNRIKHAYYLNQLLNRTGKKDKKDDLKLLKKLTIIHQLAQYFPDDISKGEGSWASPGKIK